MALLSKFILSFHMALFFFISGYSNFGKSLMFKKLVYRVKKFIFPQIVIGILNIAWYGLILSVCLDRQVNFRWIAYFLTWYLPTLSMVYILYFCVQRFCNRTLNMLILMAVSVMLSFATQNINEIFDKVHITKVPLAFFMFMFGMLWKKYECKLKNIPKVILFSGFWCSIMFLCASILFNCNVYWYNYEVGVLGWTIVSSISGCILIYSISKMIKKNELLENIGTNSLIIYTIQFFVYRCVGLLFPSGVALLTVFEGILSCIISIYIASVVAKMQKLYE